MKVEPDKPIRLGAVGDYYEPRTVELGKEWAEKYRQMERRLLELERLLAKKRDFDELKALCWCLTPEEARRELGYEAPERAVGVDVYFGRCDRSQPSTQEVSPMKVGTIVVFVAGDDHVHNGTREHPAVVTRVWSTGLDDKTPTVNLKVLPDCGEPFDATSVVHWKRQDYGATYVYHEA